MLREVNTFARHCNASSLKRLWLLGSWNTEAYSFLQTELVFLTSSVVSPGSSLMSSVSCVIWLDESSSLVRSDCSHHRSDSPKDTFCWASSGVSMFRRYTFCGTETDRQTDRQLIGNKYDYIININLLVLKCVQYATWSTPKVIVICNT